MGQDGGGDDCSTGGDGTAGFGETYDVKGYRARFHTEVQTVMLCFFSMHLHTDSQMVFCRYLYIPFILSS